MSSIKTIAIKGTIWTLIAYGGNQTLRLVSNIILTRLLVPELFGLMALVNTFIYGLNLFSDIGIRPSIIRSSRGDDPKFLNTAWTLQVIRGIGLWLACCTIAWPVAKFYQDSQFIWLLPVVGLTTMISGFNSTSLATLNRKMEISKLTKFEVSLKVLSLTITIIWAYFQKSIFALIAGNLVSSLITMIGSHRLDSTVSNRFAWDHESLKEITSFGRWIFVSTAMTFLANQSDRLIMGKLLSLELLGVYTIALTFAFLPRQVLGAISGKIILPLISQHQNLPREELRKKILKKRWFLLMGLAGIITILFVGGDLIILTLYDVRYHDAAWMLTILGIGLWPMLLHMSINQTLFAIGKPSYLAIGSSIKVLCMFIFIPIGHSLLGTLGAIIVVALNDIPSYISVNYGLWKEGFLTIKQDFQATIFLIGLISTCMMLRYLLGYGLPLSQIM
ncbi:MAG TPA: polysaccharide biosynthesis protein [Cyanothece sp. UBA12306]|nr:polysaccharide biosynthesis protein [Cyanothece sp. UBA12306]